MAAKRSIEVFEICQAQGWNINEPMSDLRPPMLGYVLSDADVTQWFLDHGAYPNARCEVDCTPFSCAVATAPLAIVQKLRSHGGDTSKGQLLHHAVLRQSPDIIDVLRMLIEWKAPINEIKYQNDAVSYRRRYAFGLGTPLHKAAEFRLYDVVLFLLQNGADCTIMNTKGKTALEEAETQKHEEVIKLLQSWTC